MKRIGEITEIRFEAGYGMDRMVATARITDPVILERLAHIPAGAPVGVSIGGKAVIHEPTLWQRFRIWLGNALINLGIKVRS